MKMTGKMRLVFIYDWELEADDFRRFMRQMSFRFGINPKQLNERWEKAGNHEFQKVFLVP